MLAHGAVDRHAVIHQPLAGGIDIVDLVGQVAERTADAVLLGVPVVGELDLRLLVARGGQEHEREAPLLVVVAPDLAQAEGVAVEAQGLVEVGHADHRVQVLHVGHPSVGQAAMLATRIADCGVPDAADLNRQPC